jgi:hypothetical protein
VLVLGVLGAAVLLVRGADTARSCIAHSVLNDMGGCPFAAIGFKLELSASQSQLRPPFLGAGCPAATSMVEHTWNLSWKARLMKVVTA